MTPEDLLALKQAPDTITIQTLRDMLQRVCDDGFGSASVRIPVRDFETGKWMLFSVVCAGALSQLIKTEGNDTVRETYAFVSADPRFAVECEDFKSKLESPE